jgi:hypothetical protein
MPQAAPLFPIATDPAPSRRSELSATLRRIDGWGPGAWREVYRVWNLRRCLLSIDDLEAGVSRDDDDRVAAFVVAIPGHALGGRDEPGTVAATCDWVLRHAWDTLLDRPGLTATTHRPGSAVRSANACVITPPSPGQPPALVLRLLVRLPLAGMCCDGKALMRFVRRIEAFAAGLSVRRRRPALLAHRRAVAVQQALRAALPRHDLVAFIGDGSRLARGGDGGAMPDCTPWRTPAGSRLTIDLGPLGRVRGLGISRGVTAVAGAPYHGKSTVLAALAAGRDDHPPGDGRELVVADPTALGVQAEDGRRIKDTDLSGFFARLPACDSRRFTTTRASGATSMAASLLQGVAAGCRLLLVDEDTAASNFLTVDPLMRRLLGHALDGTTTLLELLPALAAAGVSTVLVAGSNSLSLVASDRVLLMEHYQPQEVTRRVRRLLGMSARRAPVPAAELPGRIVDDHPDCLFGPRHFLAVDVTEPERPVVDGRTLDLRRCGWELDKALVRGALAAAAWCCRLAGGAPVALADLRQHYELWLADRGPRGLDPFDTALITVPPWQLVVTVLERLERPRIGSGSRPAGRVR